MTARVSFRASAVGPGFWHRHRPYIGAAAAGPAARQPRLYRAVWRRRGDPRPHRGGNGVSW